MQRHVYRRPRDYGRRIALAVLRIDIFAVVPDTPGLEYTLPANRLHYTVPTNRLHATFRENRLHWTLPDEDE